MPALVVDCGRSSGIDLRGWARYVDDQGAHPGRLGAVPIEGAIRFRRRYGGSCGVSGVLVTS